MTEWAIQIGAILSILAAAFIIGRVLNGVIIRWLSSVGQKTEWKLDDIVISAIRGVPLSLTVMLGIYIITRFLPLSPWVAGLAQRTLSIIVGLTITLVVARIAASLVNTYYDFDPNDEVKMPPPSLFSNILRVIIFTIGLIIILESIGVPVGPALAALGVAGLAVSLALQDTLSNIFAGAQLILARQLKPGQYVQLDSGQEGFIDDITWRSTRIRQYSNNSFIVPNSKVLNAVVLNYHDPSDEANFPVSVGVSYGSNLHHVEQVTLEVARQLQIDMPGAVDDFEPFVRFYEFADSSINMNVFLRAKTYGDSFLMKHELIKQLHQRYDSEGIEIPFPQHTVYMRQEEPGKRIYTNGDSFVKNPVSLATRPDEGVPQERSNAE